MTSNRSETAIERVVLLGPVHTHTLEIMHRKCKRVADNFGHHPLILASRGQHPVTLVHVRSCSIRVLFSRVSPNICPPSLPSATTTTTPPLPSPLYSHPLFVFERCQKDNFTFRIIFMYATTFPINLIVGFPPKLRKVFWFF